MGLGRRLFEEVRAAVRTLETYPEMGTPRNHGTRRILLARFPFDLVYIIEAESIVILALAHQRRRPGYWKGRA